MQPVFENPFSIQPRTICVLRMQSVNGRFCLCAFGIAPRQNWQEWVGAFSLLW
jgi:hypothetical protein